MNQFDAQQNRNLSPSVEIQPTLKMALFIQYLQNQPLETSDDCEAALKYWDENDLILRSSQDNKDNL